NPRPSSRPSKTQAHRKLYDARVAGAGDLAERGTVRNTGAGRVEVRVVQQIEKIASELRGDTLRQTERLRKRPIQIESPRRAQEIARAVSEGPRRRQRERRSIEPRANQLRARAIRREIRIPHQIRAIQSNP